MSYFYGRQMACPYRLSAARIMGLTAGVLLGISTGSPHGHEATRTEHLVQESQEQGGRVRCCDDGEAQHVEAVVGHDQGGYRVLLKHPHRPTEPGQWYDVPSSVVLNQPNLNGMAMVWWSPSYDSRDGSMTPVWRCFLPGPAG